MQAHDHDWGVRPLARLNHVKGYGGPIDEWVCHCGVRRVVPRGVSPSAPVCDPRNVAYDHFQDHDERSLCNGSGTMGSSNPALWLTQQEA